MSSQGIYQLIVKQYLSNTTFLISSYGAQLPQRVSYYALHSSLFGPDGTVIMTFLLGIKVHQTQGH